MKTNNSLWENPSYPFRAWHRYIPWFFRTLKFSWQRAVRGFSDYDVWDLDSYLAILIEESLTHLANTAHGCPDAADNMESWQNVLKNTAKYFHKYACENNERSLEAYIRYLRLKQELLEEHPKADVDGLLMISPALVVLRDSWLHISEEEEKKQVENLRKGMENLTLIFPYLWD